MKVQGRGEYQCQQKELWETLLQHSLPYHDSEWLGGGREVSK